MGEAPHKVSTVPTDGGAAQGTTTFTASTEAAPYLRESHAADPQNDFDIEVDNIRDIADFLAKPVNVASGSFLTTDVAGSSLYSADIVTLLEAQTIWTNKLAGYLNYRGNVKLRLVVNPTPFQAGLLRLSYFPCANQLTNERLAHMYNRMTVSQIPGTYLNLNDNFCEVTVPYLAPTTFVQRDTIAADLHVSWGRVDIHVFEPLRTGTGPVSVQWTLWMSVEDLEVSGMVQPQMADVQKKRKGRSAIDSEQNSGKGPISKIMSSGVQLATDIAALPSLAPIARPASWVLSALQGLAESFGWSKPTLNEGPCFYAKNIHWYSQNSDTNDTCAPLSLRADNKISAITDASPGAVDEMSLDFIKTRWGYFQEFTWSSLAVTGDLLYAHRVQPDSFQQNFTIGGNAAATNIPVGALSKFYNHYRGSFEYRIRLIKTGFHTGSIAVTWTPGEAAVTPGYSVTPYMYRQIIDIQEGGDFIFNLPYLVAQDYLRTNEYMGVITVHVVNPLLAPATVASTIDCMVEVRGGPDLTFTQPSGLYDMVPFVPQGIDVQNAGQSTALTLGSAVHSTNSVHHAMIANGELQLSVSDIMKASTSFRFSDTGGINYSGRPVKLATHQLYGARFNGITVTSPPLGGDLISFIGSWFVLKRGSERYRVMNLNESMTTFTNSRAMLIPAYNSPLETFSIPPTIEGSSWGALLGHGNGGTSTKCTGRIFQMCGQNGGLGVQVPFYSRYRYSLCTLKVDNTDASGYSTDGSLAFVPGGSRSMFARSLGDDFHFSYFVGIPVYTGNGVAGWNNVGS